MAARDPRDARGWRLGCASRAGARFIAQGRQDKLARQQRVPGALAAAAKVAGALLTVLAVAKREHAPVARQAERGVCAARNVDDVDVGQR